MSYNTSVGLLLHESLRKAQRIPGNFPQKVELDMEKGVRIEQSTEQQPRAGTLSGIL